MGPGPARRHRCRRAARVARRRVAHVRAEEGERRLRPSALLGANRIRLDRMTNNTRLVGDASPRRAQPSDSHQKVLDTEAHVGVLIVLRRIADSPDSPTSLTACQKVEWRTCSAMTSSFADRGERARRDSNPQLSDPVARWWLG